MKVSPKNLKTLVDYFQKKAQPIVENVFLKKIGLEISSQNEDFYEYPTEFLLENNEIILQNKQNENNVPSKSFKLF